MNADDLSINTCRICADHVAQDCASRGHRRVAIYGAGQHTRDLGLDVWHRHDINIIAILDDHPRQADFLGVPLCRPADLETNGLDAIVISSTAHEATLLARAQELFAHVEIDLVSIYGPKENLEARLKEFGIEKRRVDPNVERERLLASDLTKLNFGCGNSPLEGWTNIDGGDGSWYGAPDAREVVALDVFDALDLLPDARARFVSSEHFFEHFSLEDGHRMAREWFRILRPGGVLRIVTPDLELEARLFLRQIEPAATDVIDTHRKRWLGDRYLFQNDEQLTRAIVLNYGMRLDGHEFVYDFETISQSLRLAGFHSIERCRFGESCHEELQGIDLHDGGETGKDWIPQMALIVEATR